MTLPAPVMERHGSVWVVRDDLLPGGTKRRFLYPFLQARPNVRQWVYASPRVGYAQVALAHACRDLERTAVVVIPKGAHTPLTQEALSLGATIIEVPMGYLSHIQHVAAQYAATTPDAQLLPFGLDHPEIIQEATRVAQSLPYTPTEVWSCVSSGVLSRGLQAAWPTIPVYGVGVGHHTTPDEQGRAQLFRSPYKFAQKCPHKEAPPFPSSAFYDAKVWSFLVRHASPGALFWNVGA